MRKTTISGRLAADAEIKKTKTGTNYVQFRIASQEWGEENPTWVTVNSWSPNDISRASKVFKKGYPVAVGGSWKANAYISKQNGQANVQLDVTADWIDVLFTEKKNEDGATRTSASTTAAPATAQTVSPAPVQVASPAPATAETAVPAQVVNNMTQQPAAPVDDLPF